MQNVQVTLVQKNRLLLNDAYPDKFRLRAEQKARAIGVRVVTDDVVISEQPDANGLVHTQKGEHIQADLIVRTVSDYPCCLV